LSGREGRRSREGWPGLEVVLEIRRELFLHGEQVAVVAHDLQLLLPDLGPHRLLALEKLFEFAQVRGCRANVLADVFELARDRSHATGDDVLAQVFDRVLEVVHTVDNLLTVV
jgi:hypothetical protein